MAQLVKNPPAMRETWVRSLGWEDPLQKGKATHSRVDVIIIEIKCTINVIPVSHPQTIPPPPVHGEICLPLSQSLVRKSLGTAAPRRETQMTSLKLVFTQSFLRHLLNSSCVPCTMCYMLQMQKQMRFRLWSQEVYQPVGETSV